MTLVVNLWAGPGTGKSTNAALVFGKLKVQGYNAELVHEYAKDLVWEGRKTAIAHQPYIAAKQQFHVERVFGKVDVVVTDSPLPFAGLLYENESTTWGLKDHIIDVFRSWDTLNFFLVRDVGHHPYQQAGRSQTLAEAEEIDSRILRLLSNEGISYRSVMVGPGESTADKIAFEVQKELVRRHDEKLLSDFLNLP